MPQDQLLAGGSFWDVGTLLHDWNATSGIRAMAFVGWDAIPALLRLLMLGFHPSLRA